MINNYKYTATLPYWPIGDAYKGVHFKVFDVIERKKFLWLTYFTIIDTREFESFEKTQHIIDNFNLYKKL